MGKGTPEWQSLDERRSAPVRLRLMYEDIIGQHGDPASSANIDSP